MWSHNSSFLCFADYNALIVRTAELSLSKRLLFWMTSITILLKVYWRQSREDKCLILLFCSLSAFQYFTSSIIFLTSLYVHEDKIFNWIGVKTEDQLLVDVVILMLQLAKNQFCGQFLLYSHLFLVRHVGRFGNSFSFRIIFFWISRKRVDVV